MIITRWNRTTGSGNPRRCEPGSYEPRRCDRDHPAHPTPAEADFARHPARDSRALEEPRDYPAEKSRYRRAAASEKMAPHVAATTTWSASPTTSVGILVAIRVCPLWLSTIRYDQSNY